MARGRQMCWYHALVSILARLHALHPFQTRAAQRLAMLFAVVDFSDVLTDAMMVESGKPLGLTGAFQSVQWAGISVATILVGLAGGYFAHRRNLQGAVLAAALFPVVALVMAGAFVHEVRAKSGREELREALRGIRTAMGDRTMWVVAGFIFFWTFSPSIGIPLFYYQTDTLKFSQQFIGLLGSLGAAAQIVGAAFYAPLSRRYPLRRLIEWSIGVGVVGTLAYLLYNDWKSAMIIDITFGGLSMIVQLAFLDLAAKACPPHAEGTFFALLMSVYNFGVQGSQVAGGYLYDWIGYTPLIIISAAFTAAAWLLVPLVKIDRIEAAARAAKATSIA